MALTVVATYWSDSEPAVVTDSAENVRFRGIDDLEEASAYLDELEHMTACDCHVLPVDFPQSELATLLYEELEDLEDGCYVSLVFLVSTESETHSEREMETVIEDVEKGLLTGDLSIMKSKITATYSFQILK